MRIVLLALLAAACDSPPEEPPGDALVWGPCDPPQTLPGQCATLRVPLDWDAPDGEALNMPVLRIPARSDARLGVLVFNFGGPGLQTRQVLSGAYPDWVVPGSGVLADHFDWIVLEWRGAGTLHCMDGDAADVYERVRASPDEPRTPAEWQEVAGAARALQDACLEEYGPELLGHIDAASSARDLDALRERLGEPRLNMISFSYGTVLAATYAALFPDRVRAFVLDSPLPMNIDFRALALGQATALEEALDRFFEWCGGAPADCSFSAGSAEATAARWDALHDALEDAPLDGGAWSVDGGRMLFAAVGALYSPSNGRRPLADALVTAEDGDGARLGSLYDRGLLDEGTISALASILGVDMAPAEGFTPEALEAFLAEDVATRSPRMGALAVAGEALSADWPVLRASARPGGPVSSPPLLVTSSAHDVGTAHDWAVRLVDELDNGSFLLTADVDGHAVARSESCLGEAIVAHLFAPTTAPGDFQCVTE